MRRLLFGVACVTCLHPPAGAAPLETMRLVAAHSQKCLDVSSASVLQDFPVIQYTCHNGRNQQWLLTPAGAETYRIVAMHSGMCLDVSAGFRLVQHKCHPGPRQLWRLEQGDAGFQLVWDHQELCADVEEASTEDGRFVVAHECDPAKLHQNWLLAPALTVASGAG